jgi:PAS domain S-box-containing protein
VGRTLQARLFRALLSVALVTLLVGVATSISLHFLSRSIGEISESTWPATDAILELSLALQRSTLGLERFLDGDLDEARTLISKARQRSQQELERLDTLTSLDEGTRDALQVTAARLIEAQNELMGLRELDEVTARQLSRSRETIGRQLGPLVQQLAYDRGVSSDMLDAVARLQHMLTLSDNETAAGAARIGQLVSWVRTLPGYPLEKPLIEPYLAEVEQHAALVLEHGENLQRMARVRTRFNMLSSQMDDRLARLEARLRGEMRESSRSAIEQARDAQVMLLVAIVVAGLLAYLLARHHSRAIGHPLKELGAAVSAFGRNRSHRVDIRTGDEIEALAGAFNTMAISLESTSVARDYFDDIVTSMLDGLVVIDREGKVLLANQAAEQMVGRAAGGIDDLQFTALLDPGSHESWQRSAKTRLSAGEIGLCHTNGEPIPVLFSRARMGGPHGDRGENVVVLRDIRQRKREEEALRQAKEEAEAGERTKTEFLTNISHEIHTPLNGVIGMLQLLQESEQDREQREYIRIALHSAEALLSLLNEILDLSRMNTGKLVLVNEPFSPAAVIDEVAGMFASEAGAKQLEFACHVARDVPARVIGDANRLRQVLANLVGNAIKFTERGEVVVNVRNAVGESDATRLELVVRDTGIGIATETQAHLFDSFSQGDATTSRRHGGPGLGLAIVHQLCTLMGGEITCASQPGEGSSFIVRLPLPAAEDGQVDTTPLELPGRQLLLVDPNPTVQAAFTDLLTATGAEVTCSDSVDDALLQITARDTPPDLSLFDTRLIDDTPHASLKRLETLVREAELPLVLLQMKGARERPVWGVLAEAPCIDKPLRRETLFEHLPRLLPEGEGSYPRSA